MSDRAFDLIGSRIQNYVDHPQDAHARDLVDQALETTGTMNDKQRLSEMTRQLEATGLLPKFLEAEIGHIAPDSSVLDRDDLQSVVSDPTHHDAASVLAAQYGLRNYGNIRHAGEAWQTFFNGIGSNMIESFAASQKESGIAQDPDVAFSGGIRDNGPLGICPANGDDLASWQGGGSGHKVGKPDYDEQFDGDQTMQRVKGAHYKEGYGDNDGYEDSLVKHGRGENAGYGGTHLKEGHADQSDMRGMSDADFGPGRVCINGKEGYQVGDRAFVKNASGRWQYTIRQGDTLDGISRAILRDKNGYEPTNAQVVQLRSQFAEENKYNHGGRSPDRIYAGDTLIVPENI